MLYNYRDHLKLLTFPPYISHLVPPAAVEYDPQEDDEGGGCDQDDGQESSHRPVLPVRQALNADGAGELEATGLGKKGRNSTEINIKMLSYQTLNFGFVRNSTKFPGKLFTYNGSSGNASLSNVSSKVSPRPHQI